ncbi:MAG: hypothetical protein JOZ70_05665 [Pseudolabrys sp.]|nr:hypothetical protein [Pseudolabrys sp.]
MARPIATAHHGLRARLAEIADLLEQTHKELDAKKKLIQAQPPLDANVTPCLEMRGSQTSLKTGGPDSA